MSIQIIYNGITPILRENFDQTLQKIEEYFEREHLEVDKEVILYLTDNYEGDIDEFAEKNGLNDSSIKNLRGEVGTSKILPFENKLHVFFRAPDYIREKQIDALFHTLLTCTKNATDIGSRIIFINKEYVMNDIEKGVRNLVQNWARQIWIRNKIESISFFHADQSPELAEPLSALSFWEKDDHKRTLNNFRSRIRDCHFEYYSDNNLAQLYLNIGNTIDAFGSHATRKFLNDNDLSVYEEFSPILTEVFTDMLDFFNQNDTSSCLDSSRFIDSIYAIYKLCGLNNFDLHGKPQAFIINSDPRSIFRKEYIGSTKSIVAFIDILGFKKHIHEYQRDPTSDILRSLKEALDITMNLSLGGYAKYSPLMMNEISKALAPLIEFKIEDYLEYKFFSDCLSISNLYVDKDDIFFAELFKTLVLASSYQYILMTKGFFVRGGVSLGLYYSDNNMIFSSALVSAYLLETKRARNPRIVLDEKIVTRLVSMKQLSATIYGLYDTGIWDKFLVRDNHDKLIFINPFFCYLQANNTSYPDLYSDIQSIYINILTNKSEHKINTKEYRKYSWLEKLLIWFTDESKYSGKFEYVKISTILPNQTIPAH